MNDIETRSAYQFMKEKETKPSEVQLIKQIVDAIKAKTEENDALNSMVIPLRKKKKELETDLGGLETTASKSGIALTVIQRENKEYQTKILELESRIQHVGKKKHVIYKKLDELASHLTVITGIDIPNTATGLDILITKVIINYLFNLIYFYSFFFRLLIS